VKYSTAVIDIRTQLSQGPVHDQSNGDGKSSNELVINISDQGVGIPHGDLKQVFKRFYRTGPARNKTKGTGLGLFIVRSIIKKHRGDVTAHSDGEGRGTTMTLRLPCWVPA
jgi:signal transduction histidine kinase